MVAGDKLDRCGMLIDFKVLKSKLEHIVEELDHRFLNELESFGGDGRTGNPTAENIARYVFERMRAGLDGLVEGVGLRCVRIWESPDAWASYYAD